MAGSVTLVTGFEPYGGRGINAASEVVKRLGGLEIEDARVVGRVLPVSFGALPAWARELMWALDPRVVVSLGLWPGEPTDPPGAGRGQWRVAIIDGASAGAGPSGLSSSWFPGWGRRWSRPSASVTIRPCRP